MRRIFILLSALILSLASMARAEDAPHFYPASWVDSSGKDGKGGVSIVVSGNMRQLLVRPDPCKEKIDNQTRTDSPQWVVYDSESTDNCLSYEFTWVTTANDKFWGMKWSGGGLAFNNSWSTLNITDAKYLVFYAKTNAPGVDFNMSLTGDKDSVATGSVKMNDFAEGHKVGEKWTRVVIPFSALPDRSKMDFANCKTIRFDLAGDYPENKKVYIHIDKVYFTAAKLVTPVSNVGWLRLPDAVYLVWDKSKEEEVDHFLISVDGKPAGQVDGAERSVNLPLSLFGGTGSHAVGVAAANLKQTSSYQTVNVDLKTVPAQTATVKLSAKPDHPISPYIYGFNYMSTEALEKTGGALNRWGGNDTTGYNWKDDADNHGSDWFFLNTGGPVGIAEKDKRYYKFIQETLAAGSDAIITIPITGWVAKVPPNPNVKFGSFPTSLFPTEAPGGEPGLGKGETADGKKLWGNDPNYNYLPNSPEFEAEWVKTIVKNFGPSSKGGVKFYQMDNEPGLWNESHRDAVPKGYGYDELVDLNEKYAAAVKAVDPNAKVDGMVAWGVMELAGSPWDYMPGGVKGYKKEGDGEKWTDRKAHGDVPQVVWFLKEMSKRSQKAGKRLIDYIDTHGFPEVWGKDQNGKGIKLITDDLPYDPVIAQKQFDALRIFWDPTFENPDSWCANPGNKPYLWDPFVGLIPKMKKIIAENYPGTKLAMTEY
ncbi:MAG TPA: glycoside hydrolase family 44 protein, partial [bacterium]|nr:glycoside hydrolase family 44 protein [bacterium]